MNDSRCCVSWDSYSNDVSKGFSSLQQNEEFVDMTLAAEGHLVKVHQNVMALASPYLKAMLQSASCRHPVIFLNNLSHEILGFILEYIYTGEVKIPTTVLDKFVESCKSLCIRGVDTIVAPMVTAQKEIDQSIERVDNPPGDNFVAHITINPQENNYNLEVLPINVAEDNNIQLTAPSTQEMERTTESQIDCYDTVSRQNDIQENKGPIILFKPKNYSTTSELNTNDEHKTVKILSNTLINSHQQKKPRLEINISEQQDHDMEPVNPIVIDPVNIVLNTDTWPNETSQHVSLTNNNAGSEEHTVNVLHTEDWRTNMQPEPNQNNPEFDTNTIQYPVNIDEFPSKPSPSSSYFESYVNSIAKPDDFPLKTGEWEFKPGNTSSIKLIKNDLQKNLKKISSHMKLNSDRKGKVNKMTLNRAVQMYPDTVPYYTISNRGSLQLLLNHFLYHSHHHSNRGSKRRWRCIDYRRIHCPAYIDTVDEDITVKSENHQHPNHDHIIRKKNNSNIVFTSLTNAVNTIKNLVEENEDSNKFNELDTQKTE